MEKKVKLAGYRFDEELNRYFREEGPGQQIFRQERAASAPASAQEQPPRSKQRWTQRDSTWLLKRAAHRTTEFCKLENSPERAVQLTCLPNDRGMVCVLGKGSLACWRQDQSDWLVTRLVRTVTNYAEPLCDVLVGTPTFEPNHILPCTIRHKVALLDMDNHFHELGARDLGRDWLVNSLCHIPSHNQLAVLGETPKGKSKGVLLDERLDTVQHLPSTGHRSQVTCSFNPRTEPSQVLVGFRQGVIQRWDLRSNSCKQQILSTSPDAPIRSLLQSSTCPHLVSVHAPITETHPAGWLVDVRFAKEPVASYGYRCRMTSPCPCQTSKQDNGGDVLVVFDTTKHQFSLHDMETALHIADIPAPFPAETVLSQVLMPGSEDRCINLVVSSPDGVYKAGTESEQGD